MHITDYYCIFTYIYKLIFNIFMVNVGKDTIDWPYGMAMERETLWVL